MNINIDPQEGYTETHTGRIARPTIKPVTQRIPSPTIPSSASDTQVVKPVVNPLETKPVISEGKKSSDTVSISMVQQPKKTENTNSPVTPKIVAPKLAAPKLVKPVTAEPTATAPTDEKPVATATVKLRPPVAENPATDIVKPQVVASVAQPDQIQSATQTVKLKPASNNNATTKIKATPQSKTVKMKAVSDVKPEKIASVAPLQPLDDESDDQPGIFLTLIKVASVAVASAAIYYSVISLDLIGTIAQ
ncbi:MAG: hypothetical protein ACRC37_07440 [Lentisphaeria bacterium]